MIKTCAEKRSLQGKSSPLHVGQKIDYALFFLATLAGNPRDKHSSIRSLAEDGKLSFAFLQKIAHGLKKAGLVRASRGKVGGYYLARPASRISFREIIEALNGEKNFQSCAGAVNVHSSCPRKQFCRVRSAISRIDDEIREQYYSKSLSDFLY